MTARRAAGPWPPPVHRQVRPRRAAGLSPWSRFLLVLGAVDVTLFAVAWRLLAVGAIR